MKNTKHIFHILSYLQYPFLAIAIYFVSKPYIDGIVGDGDKLMLVFENINNMLMFLGIGIGFSSLQDTNKTSFSFEKKIWQNPNIGRWIIVFMMILLVIILFFGFFGYFISENELVEEVSVGSIVLGVGLIGFLKVLIEIFENHRADKNTNIKP